MDRKKILLSLDGSAQSLYAAEICWKMAQLHGCSISAQHVIDTPGIWSFLAHDLPGLIGSGPYLTAQEAILQQLCAVGSTLLDAYELHAESRGVQSHTNISHGNPVSEICRLAPEYDLVVTGHRPGGIMSPSQDRRRFPRYSTAEKLAHCCNSPLMVVQEHCEEWKSITVLLSVTRAYPNALFGALEYAQLLCLPVHIKYWLQEQSQEIKLESATKGLNKILEAYPSLSISVQAAIIPTASWTQSIEFDRDSLLLVPTTINNITRETSFGISTDSLVRYCPQSTILLWPEEYALPSSKKLVATTIGAE